MARHRQIIVIWFDQTTELDPGAWIVDIRSVPEQSGRTLVSLDGKARRDEAFAEARRLGMCNNLPVYYDREDGGRELVQRAK